MPETYVPFEIQAQIIKRVAPVKSLIRFRSVSKQWKSLIDSSEFITQHSLVSERTQPHHLLLRYEVASGYKYVSVVDDDSFPELKFSPVVSPTVNLVKQALMIDSSHGLVCLYGYDADDKKTMIVIWNPSIGKSVSIELPHRTTHDLGFGVCPKTSDIKIVMISRSYEHGNFSWKVEVLTLGSGVWRSISMNIHLSRSTLFKSEKQVVIDGVIYWVAHEYYSSNDEGHDLIISFDLTSEEFKEVALVPDSLANGNLSISKLNESLVVLDIDKFKRICDVWMMLKNGFVKLFSLGDSEDDCYTLYDVIGFRRNGQPIRFWFRYCRQRDCMATQLAAFEPSTKLKRDLGIYVPSCSCFHFDVEPSHIMITSYTESLLLLNYSGI